MMKESKRSSEVSSDSYLAYSEALNQMNKCRGPDLLTSKSIELVEYDPESSGIKSGSIHQDYITSHDENIGEIGIIPTSTDRLSQQYISQHDERLDEPHESQSLSLNNKQTDTEDDGAVSRVPFEVQVKTVFLEKRIVRCCGSRVFLYIEEFGILEEQTEHSLHIEIRRSLSLEMDMRLNRQKIIDVVHRIVSDPDLQISHDEFDSHVHLINFKDCVYDVTYNQSYPHSPDYLFTSYIDAEYERAASRIRVISPTQGQGYSYGDYFKKFVIDCTMGDQLSEKSLQQLTGYIISNEWRAKKFFALIGQPHTGKSVWLALWRELIGPRFTTAMSLKQLSETRFMTAELFKSKLNISAEMDENGTLKGTDVIKTITGGDLITAEKKGKDPFQFYCKTKLVAAGNHMPLLNKLDGTSAFTDRILFLIFNNTIPEEQRDKSLLDKLMSEKSYIIEWALEGLRELKRNNLVFTESDEARTFKLRYINELNNVTEFVRDRCYVELDNDDCKVHRRTIYPAYKQYCRDNGFKAVSKQEFFVEIAKLNAKSGKFRVDGSTPLEGFRGIRLLTIAEQNS